MLPSHDRFQYSGIKSRPKFNWPDNKRLALYIAVNIEHFPYGVQCGVDLDRQTQPWSQRSWLWREYGNRVGAWRYLISVMRDEDIVNWLHGEGELQDSLREDTQVRDKIAEMWTEAEVCRLMTMRSISIEQSGGKFTYEGSAEKVFAPEHSVRTTEAISQILGPFAQLMQGSPTAIEKGVFAHNILGAYQSTINHGSVQVMRDQVARIGLGLPRAAK